MKADIKRMALTLATFLALFAGGSASANWR